MNHIKYVILSIFLITNLNAEQSKSLNSLLQKATLAPRTSFPSTNVSQLLPNAAVKESLLKQITGFNKQIAGNTSDVKSNAERRDAIIKTEKEQNQNNASAKAFVDLINLKSQITESKDPTLRKKLVPLLKALLKSKGNSDQIDITFSTKNFTTIKNQHENIAKAMLNIFSNNNSIPTILSSQQDHKEVVTMLNHVLGLTKAASTTEEVEIEDIDAESAAVLKELMNEIEKGLNKKLNLIASSDGVYSGNNYLLSDNVFINYDLALMKNTKIPIHLRELFQLLVRLRKTNKRDLEYSLLLIKEREDKLRKERGGKLVDELSKEDLMKLPKLRQKAVERQKIIAEVKDSKEFKKIEREVTQEYDPKLTTKTIENVIAEETELLIKNALEKAMRKFEDKWAKDHYYEEVNATDQLIDNIFIEFNKYFLNLQENVKINPLKHPLNEILKHLTNLANLKKDKNTDLDNSMVAEIIKFAMFVRKKNGKIHKNTKGIPTLTKSISEIGKRGAKTGFNILKEMFLYKSVTDQITITGLNDLEKRIATFHNTAA